MDAIRLIMSGAVVGQELAVEFGPPAAELPARSASSGSTSCSRWPQL